jgi:hypothetical protein
MRALLHRLPEAFLECQSSISQPVLLRRLLVLL